MNETKTNKYTFFLFSSRTTQLSAYMQTHIVVRLFIQMKLAIITFETTSNWIREFGKLRGFCTRWSLGARRHALSAICARRRLFARVKLSTICYPLSAVCSLLATSY